MNRTLEKFIGKQVSVTLSAAFEHPLIGELVECDGALIVIEHKEWGEVVIPLTAVSYVFSPAPATAKVGA